MRFCSTPESAANGEITLLAIIETLVAICLSIFLVKLLDGSAHIVIGALMAPFLFLRTETSTAKAFKIFDCCLPRLTKLLSFFQRLYQRLPGVLRAFTFFIVWLPLFSLLLVLVKSIATLGTLVAFPRDAVRAIPGNWFRTALATDFAHPPEFLAGVETAVDDAPATIRILKYDEVRRQITSGIASPLFQKLSLLVIWVPTVIYRCFLKSTSLIYFPLIWVTGLPLTARGILSLPLERVRRWYACALLVIMLSPALISFRIHETLTTARDQAIFSYVLPVHRMDWWHISRVIAVAVTIALYFCAKKLDQDSLQHPERVRWIITRANHLRAACGVFTLACFALIILTL